MSDDARARISAALKGREIGTTWRLRMSIAQRRRFARAAAQQQREAGDAPA